MLDERWIRNVCVRSLQLCEGIQEEGECFSVQYKGLIEEATFSTCNLIPLDCSSKTFYFFFYLHLESWTNRPSKCNLKIALSNKT